MPFVCQCSRASLLRAKKISLFRGEGGGEDDWDLSFLLRGIVGPIGRRCPSHPLTETHTRKTNTRERAQIGQVNTGTLTLYDLVIAANIDLDFLRRSSITTHSSSPLPNRRLLLLLLSLSSLAVHMALCRNRLSEERKLWRKDHPYVCPHRDTLTVGIRDSTRSQRKPPMGVWIL